MDKIESCGDDELIFVVAFCTSSFSSAGSAVLIEVRIANANSAFDLDVFSEVGRSVGVEIVESEGFEAEGDRST